MKHIAFVLCLLALAACKEEVAQDVSAVRLNPQAVGHYCQMELLEHEGPKGQAHLAGLPGAPLFFSQVRDAVAYMRMPEQSHAILAVWVNDMGAAGASWANPGANNWIRAEDAFFVIGADVKGGMGAPELVPFSDPALAKAFAAENGGTVATLDQIPNEAVLAPVDLDGVAQGDDSDTDFEQRLRALSRKTGG
jgi:copper chaperone NosL